MSFSISIIKNPSYTWDARRKCDVINWDDHQNDRHLDFNFDEKDFNELHNFLDIKLPPAIQGTGESYPDYEKRLKDEFFKAAKEKGYEMLSRIWYWYESVAYMPTEINQLFEECLKLKEKAQNSDQLIAVDKLIIASSEALKTNSGIFLGSD